MRWCVNLDALVIGRGYQTTDELELDGSRYDTTSIRSSISIICAHSITDSEYKRGLRFTGCENYVQEPYDLRSSLAATESNDMTTNRVIKKRALIFVGLPQNP